MLLHATLPIGTVHGAYLSGQRAAQQAISGHAKTRNKKKNKKK
jgi:hypothetical protein